MKISRIYRLLRLITMLQGNRTHTVDELADQLEVSRRTVFRDLQVLEMAHIPYYHDRQVGGYRIDPRFFLPPVNLTLTEALAILAMTGRVRSSAQVPLQAEAARAAVKLESILPEQIGQYVGSVLEKLSVHWTPVSEHAQSGEMMETVVQAIVDKRCCRAEYQSFYEGSAIQTVIRPLRVVFIERGWYVIAYSEMHQEIRTFKLMRFARLEPTDQTFAEPADVDLDDYFADAWRMIPEGQFYDVHLHFAPKVAANVAEVQWHRTQQIETNEDGSIEYRVRVNGLGEISWWLMGYGDQVKVVGPPELKERVVAAARNVLGQYGQAAGAAGEGSV